MLNSDKNQPLSHLFHDLNNIFTRILNAVELLKKKVINYEEVNPIINSIENGTYLASEIIEELIAESINKLPKKKRINLNTLINDLVNTLNIQVKDKINFELNLEPNLYLVEGKYSDFYRVMLNLIVNSTEAIKEKGNITITTSNIDSKSDNELKLFENQSYVQIKISDTGIGIDSSILPYIFDENFTTKNNIKNRGIGLSIVNKIINSYNGIIKVKSDAGKGTEFTILIPSIETKKNKSYFTKKTILVAEDESILRELLSELLESYGFNVISAVNGNEVLEKMSFEPDLLIIDQKMPDMDGISCILKVRQSNKTLPIILATGTYNQLLDNEEFRYLVTKVINKPYNFEEILSIIREILS
ncbi:MAG: response regulator [Melioribacter sp.]|nr:response regulator [Melioribacter sp.]